MDIGSGNRKGNFYSVEAEIQIGTVENKEVLKKKEKTNKGIYDWEAGYGQILCTIAYLTLKCVENGRKFVFPREV